jgi:uncharacterized membrane protein (DUF485 family)
LSHVTQDRPSPAAREAGSHRTAEVLVRARAHRRAAFGVLAVNSALYATLILLIAFGKPLLARLIAPGLSLAIVFGALVTVAAWLLTLVYVRWANTHDHAPAGDRAAMRGEAPR